MVFFKGGDVWHLFAGNPEKIPGTKGRNAETESGWVDKFQLCPPELAVAIRQIHSTTKDVSNVPLKAGKISKASLWSFRFFHILRTLTYNEH